MENLPTYRLTQSGPEAQEILDQVNLNTIDIEQLKRLYQALNQSDPEIIEPNDTWPVANPEENVIYRVIDRVNTPPQYYSDYMWNGTSMVLMGQYNNAIDNEPTANSNNLVKSGGVYSFVHANGGAYDISAAHAVGGVLATYDDLADALGTNGANVPSGVRKGGMSIKYVNSSDNKYVRFNYLKSSTSDADFANVANWQECVSYKDVCSHVFTTGDIANKLIKELYLYKQDGTPINETLHVSLIGKNSYTGGYYYYLVIKNSSDNTVSAWLAETISSDIVEVSMSGSIKGNAILDFSKIDDGSYSEDAEILECAYDIKCSPYFNNQLLNEQLFSNVLDTKTLCSLNNNLGIDGFRANVVATGSTIIAPSVTGSRAYSLLLNIKKDDVIKVKAISHAVLLSILKEFDSHWVNLDTQIDISSYYASGETRRTITNTETSITVTSSDAKYLMVALFADNGSSWMPDALSINNVDIPLTPLREKLSDISDDFSLLENEFDLLKEQVEDDIVISTEEIDVTNDAILTANKYLANDGVTVVDNYTDFYIAEIPLRNDVVSVGVTGTHFALGASLVFKDSNNNILGSVITVSSTAYGTVSANKPLNAVKAFTTYRNRSSSDRPVVFKTLNRCTVKDKIIEAEIIDYQYTDDKTYDVGLVQGSANTAWGTVSENSSFGKSGKVDISQYDFVRICNIFSNNICYAKWFDDNDVEVLPMGIGDGTSNLKYMDFKKPQGATKVEISVISWNNNNHYVGFGKYNNTVASDENGLLQQTEIMSLPNVSMIPIFGQSLSVGAAATPSISKQCKYPAGIMFTTGVIAIKKEVSYFVDYAPLEELGVETVASGCLEQLVELLQKENGISAKSKFWQNHKFLFVSCGEGSSTIDMLMENNYQGLVNAVQGGKNIATAKGWSFDVPAVIYIQGETDQKPGVETPYATYKAALQNFANTFDTDVKQITGQKKDVKVIMYQTASQSHFFTPTYDNYTAMDVPTAQMDFGKKSLFG